jgi:glycosyltransferase involved in cell wall biosynthesis
MKVGIITDRLERPLTGIGNYIYNLVDGFAKIGKEQDIVCISYAQNESFPKTAQLVIPNPLRNYFKKGYILWHLYMPLCLKISKTNPVEIIHSPENGSLFFKVKPIRQVITVHDVISTIYPESFTAATTIRYKLFFSRTLKSADKIIADSENTKNDLMRYYHVPDDKIKVIPLGVEKRFCRLNPEAVEDIRRRYHLDFPFILYTGTLEPRKNLPALIKAFSVIKLKHHHYKLVIAGMKGWKYQGIFDQVTALDLEKDVVFTGYVPDEDLPALYNAAEVFVYPSFYEGFGLPPLEAMACGCPVITSNTSSLPEVVGNAGIMIDPNDHDELVQAIDSVLSDLTLKEKLRELGQERAKEFSWEKCATETWSVYAE